MRSARQRRRRGLLLGSGRGGDGDSDGLSVVARLYFERWRDDRRRQAPRVDDLRSGIMGGTKDIDIVPDPSEANLARLADALEDLGAAVDLADLDPSDTGSTPASATRRDAGGPGRSRLWPAPRDGGGVPVARRSRARALCRLRVADRHEGGCAPRPGSHRHRRARRCAQRRRLSGRRGRRQDAQTTGPAVDSVCLVVCRLVAQ